MNKIDKLIEELLDEDKISKIINLVEMEDVDIYLNNRNKFYKVEYVLDDIQGNQLGIVIHDENGNEELTWDELFNQKFKLYIVERKEVEI